MRMILTLCLINIINIQYGKDLWQYYDYVASPKRAVVLVRMTYIYTAALSIGRQYNLLSYQH